MLCESGINVHCKYWFKIRWSHSLSDSVSDHMKWTVTLIKWLFYSVQIASEHSVFHSTHFLYITWFTRKKNPWERPKRTRKCIAMYLLSRCQNSNNTFSSVVLGIITKISPSGSQSPFLMSLVCLSHTRMHSRGLPHFLHPSISPLLTDLSNLLRLPLLNESWSLTRTP